MKKIIKLSSLIVIALLCLSLLIACASDEGGKTEDPSSTVSQTPTETPTGNNGETPSGSTNKPDNDDTDKPSTHVHTEVIDAGLPVTCTTPGLSEGKHCSTCGQITVEQEIISALGHDTVNHDAKPATCTEAGHNAYISCSRCNYTTYSEISALGHNTETHSAKPATCTEAGYDAYVSCTRCDYSTYSEIAATGHSTISHAEKPATCTEGGYKAYVTCSNCSYTTYEAVSALGHQIVTHEAKAPTCQDIGWNAYNTCNRCNYTTYSELSATGVHTDADKNNTCDSCGEIIDKSCQHTDTTNIPAKAATCTEDGNTDAVVCNDCGTYVSGNVIKAVGYHTEETVKGYAATCTENGLTDGVQCSVCKEFTTPQQSISALGHNITPHAEKSATCTEDGWNAYEECSKCDYTTYEAVLALGHDITTHAAKSATCTEDGWNEYEICSRCDLNTYEKINALGHTEKDMPALDATCTVNGNTAGVICSVCNAVISGYEAIPAAHAYSGVCDTDCDQCGQTRTGTPAHKYGGDCDATCNGCGLTRTVATQHATTNTCDDSCNLCGETGLATHDNGYLHGVCSIEGCGATDPAYAGVEGVMTYQQAWDYEADNGDYYLDGNDAENIGSSYSHDGYVVHPNSWIMTGDVATNPAANGHKYPTDGTPIRIDANSAQPYLNMCGWLYFGTIGGELAVENFAIFADKITDKSQIIDNTESDTPGFLEIWNGTGTGAAATGGIHTDVQTHIGEMCRRYCITIFNTNNTLWGELKNEPGIHKLYLTAKMKDGTYVVFKSVKIEVVAEHTHKYEQAASNATCMPSKVVSATCEAGGYTELGCIGVDAGCTTMKKINEVPALGHKAASTWTSLNGEHWKVCQNGCGQKQNAGICVDNNNNARCDTCNGVLHCDHVYSFNNTTGEIKCTGACGSVIATPLNYFVGTSLKTSNANSTYNSGNPTWNSSEQYVGIKGAGQDVAYTDTVNSKTMSFLCGPTHGNSDEVFNRYIVMEYRTSDNGIAADKELFVNFCNYGSPATSGQISYRADGGWTAQAFDMKDAGAAGQRIDIRFNIGGSSQCETHVRRIMSFATQAEAEAWAEAYNAYMQANA